MTNHKIKALQTKMINQGIDLYYLNTSDYHMSEYVPEYFKTIAYFTGFSGSLASLIISQTEAFIFVDGRYHTQADRQCLKNDVKVVKLGTKGALEPADFIIKNYDNPVVGLDGKRTSISFAKKLRRHNIKIRSIDIYSQLIEDRQPLKKEKIYELNLRYTGLTRAKKIELVQHCLNGKCHIVNNLESIAYILNLRSNDILYTPVFMSYLIFFRNRIYLFCDINRFSKKTVDALYTDKIIVRPYDTYYKFLTSISHETVFLDENKVNYETYLRISSNGNTIYNKRSVIEDMKSIKNAVEQENIRLAHISDGIAMLRFLMWIDNQDKSTLTEYDVAEKINSFRFENGAVDLSFNSIVAYNENSAVIHYSPSKNNSARLNNNGVLLVDTGGQYYEGTTDITRTIALGPVDDEVKKYFSVVLKSMFNLSEFKFVEGLNGSQVDVIARKELWSQGLDYRHGTGHGVGNMLSVHEGPPNIRYMHTSQENELVTLCPGMVFSDEPGIYFEGKFGIRCENLLLCQNDYENEYGKFLKFETLTLVPFDLNLIDIDYLDEETIIALNNYHKNVYDTLSPYLSDEENDYLRKLTREI